MTGRRSAGRGSVFRRRGVVIGAVLAAVVVGGGVTGVALASTVGSDGSDGRAGSAPSSSASASAGSGSAGSGSAGSGSAGSGSAGSGSAGSGIEGFQDPAAPAARSAATPVSVSIPAIGVQSNLEDLHRGTAGELDPPVDWDSAGWFSDGIVPGEVGPAVIAGHVDSPTSAAVFFRLDELVAGDEIHVAMSDGSTRTFTVDRSERAAKSAFPTSDVYGTTPTPQLRLITCDGVFDTATGHYTDNLIVFADLSSD
ncbi:class F sortase [Curtobacterium sp. MCJR17_020]|uniref:class F sortase n=1 Tax=Curtobacterium sp. MCJR17_020 TaxID=2175619 RepID=UPI000DA84E53|nr:class F sortase [Curtobacterium sp. MCJR17_020]WIE73208.1 class F sortase [Curtobacterium sp. MCJR17_020]